MHAFGLASGRNGFAEGLAGNTQADALIDLKVIPWLKGGRATATAGIFPPAGVLYPLPITVDPSHLQNIQTGALKYSYTKEIGPYRCKFNK